MSALPYPALSRALETCLSRDRSALRQKLRQLRDMHASGKPVEQLLDNVQQAIQTSQAHYAARAARCPVPVYDDALPVNQRREDILRAIAAHQVVIVCGETGSGKTTQLPKLCLELGRGIAGMIGHTQPRRLAARTVANRIAQELQSDTGDLVGYKVRFTDKTSELSLIKLMTDGILLAETQTDRYLSRYDTLIVDEAHERSLNIDFLLGFLKQLLPRRPDLKVIVTSATIDAERFARHFSGAPVIEVSGRTYPVEIRYHTLQSRDDDDAELEMEEAVVQAVEHLWRHDGAGDVLVFLPGEREIRETAEELRKARLMGAEILPLLARLSVEDQQRVFRPSNGRRIVLATNVAETSLTVPGIRYVIDSGLARLSRYAPRAKVEQLQIEKISQASARQRAGRCGRVAAGVCVRLYPEADFNARPAFTDPEIVRSSLASVILRMQALRLGKIEDFPFLEAPSGRLIADGYQLLHELGAVDEQGSLTRLGQELARLPIDPRIGRLLLAGRDESCLAEVLIIASALSIQDPRDRPFEARDAADRAHARFADPQSDFVSFLNLWAFFEEALANKPSNRLLVQQCHAHFLSYLRLREWRELHAQLAEIVAEMGYRLNPQPAKADALHRALCTGLLGHVGMKQTDSDEYLGARGLKFAIFPGSGLKKTRPKWVVSAELVETTKLYARCVAAIQPEWLEKIAGHLVKRDYFDPHWEEGPAQVVVSERVTLYGLPLIAKRKVHFGPIDPVQARQIMIREGLAGRRFNTRAEFWQHNEKLIAEIEELEHKARRQDVLVDEHTLYAFYDARIPEGIVNGHGFEAWRKQAETENPNLLHLNRDDLMRHGGEAITEVQFPVALALPQLSLPLAYRFEPGHALDGVTVQLPLHLLNSVNGAVFDWLVPGLAREQISTLVKALPKAQRRLCVPVPEFVTRMLLALDKANRQAALLPQLAAAVSHAVGQTLRAEDFNLQALPPHLRMNIRVVDEAGQELASGRDLQALRVRLGEAAQMTFRALASTDAASVAPPRPEAHKNGRPAAAQPPVKPLPAIPAALADEALHDNWDFGDLPESLALERQGTRFTAYPALVPQQTACVIRLFDTEAEALAQHRLGVVRLLTLALKEPVKHLPKCFAQFNQTALLLRQLCNSDVLMEDLLACILDRALVGDDPLPRSQAAFESQKQRAKARLPAVRDSAWRVLAEVAALYPKVQAQIGQTPKLQATLQAHLGRLVYKGFLAATPWEQLAHLPRYLNALLQRMEKYPKAPERDAQRSAELAALWAGWQATQIQWQTQGRDIAPLQPFRWMLEELHVSLFAQELRTPYPVSVKRLNKLWQELTDSTLKGRGRT